MVACLTPQEALGGAVDWAEVDVLLLDVWDLDATGMDRFVGVGVAEHVRAQRPLGLREAWESGRLADHTTIIAVSRHLPGALLSRRLAEAGVDLRFDRDDEQVRRSALLAELVARPYEHLKRLPTPDVSALGVTATTRVNDLVAEASTAEPADLFRSDRRPDGDAERVRWERRLRRFADRHALVRPTDRPAGGPHRARGFGLIDLRAVLDRARGRPPFSGGPG